MCCYLFSVTFCVVVCRPFNSEFPYLVVPVFRFSMYFFPSSTSTWMFHSHSLLIAFFQITNTHPPTLILYMWRSHFSLPLFPPSFLYKTQKNIIAWKSQLTSWIYSKKCRVIFIELGELGQFVFLVRNWVI